MSTIYLVAGASGRYDSRVDWIVRAELSREAALRHIATCLEQLERGFDKYEPQSPANFTIPADPSVTINPFFAGSLPPKEPGGVPGEWFEHGVSYEVIQVELNDGVHDLVVLHRCHKFV